MKQTSLTKWLSVHIQIWCMWVRVPLQSLGNCQLTINKSLGRFLRIQCTALRKKCYSEFPEIIYRTPFHENLFFIKDDIDFARYADHVLLRMLFSNWKFIDNQMKTNPNKHHFICITNDALHLIVKNQVIDNSRCWKLLDLKLDHR